MTSLHPLTNQHLLELARSGRLRLPTAAPESVKKAAECIYPLLAIFFTVAIPFLSAIPSLLLLLLLASILGITLPEMSGLSGSVDPLALAFLLITSYAPIILGTWLWVWLFEARSLNSLGLEAGGAVHKFWQGLILGWILIGISVAGNAAFGYIKIESIPGDNQILWRASTALLLLAAWTVQGASEEILTRGYLLPVISIRYGTVAGILISSIVFMLLHLLNFNLTWIGMLNLALFGVFAALYALAEGSVWGIAGLHAAWNWTQGSLLGLPVSGSPLSNSSLLVLTENGPDWLTGGAFGPEGGIWVTLILLTAIIYLLRRGKSKYQYAG